MAVAEREGMFIIADISGYTEFLQDVEINHSEHVISGLLELLIDNNSIGMELIEIEGDALFFCRPGAPPPMSELNGQILQWMRGFHGQLKSMEQHVYCGCGACQGISKLGLKMVGHFGNYGEHSIKNRKKIMGRDIIQVHRMLKNSLGFYEYALLTDALLERCGSAEGFEFSPHRERYEHLGEIRMQVLDLSWVRDDIPAPASTEFNPVLENKLSAEIRIDAPFEKVVAEFIAIDRWSNWMQDMDVMEFDRDSPLRAGQSHVCVFPDAPITLTLEQIARSDNEFSMRESFKPPPMLKGLNVENWVRRESDHLMVGQFFYYSRKPVIGWLFDLLGAPTLRRRSRQSLLNIKNLVEGAK